MANSQIKIAVLEKGFLVASSTFNIPKNIPKTSNLLSGMKTESDCELMPTGSGKSLIRPSDRVRGCGTTQFDQIIIIIMNFI